MNIENMTKEELSRFIKENEPHPLHDSARENDLDSFIDAQKNVGFSDLLFSYIRESGISEVECYKRAGLTPQHFSKIRSNRDYRPTKNTVIALALSLKLDLPKTKELLRSAGYAFTHSDKRDIVVEYYIINGIRDLMEVNSILDSYGLEMIKI